MRDSNVQLHHDRILGYQCVDLCVQSSIHVTPLSFFGENFRTFLIAQHIFHHFFFTTPIFSLTEMYFKTNLRRYLPASLPTHPRNNMYTLS